MMVGLAAPAFAAAPVISSFTPASGPAAGCCVVLVTGTALDDFATATITFESTTPATTTIDSAAAGGYVLVSDTEAWVESPLLDSGAEYNIKFVNAGGSNTSTTAFLATAGPGACAPTITTVTPNCGSHNDKVVIAGTNLLLDGAGANDIAGATVQFSTGGVYTIADVVPPDSDTATQLTRFVSSGASDGPIKVTAGGGSVFSADSFAVPPPDCVAVVPTSHARSITLTLKKHLVAKGVVSSTEDPAFTDCVASVPVKIQRKTSSGWKNVGSTTTTATGSYKKTLKDKPGKYRAIAKKVSLGDPVTDVCSKATSPVRKHKH
jgi:IPT/TIG domain